MNNLVGRRVRLIGFSTINEDGTKTIIDDNFTVPPGTIGTVTDIDDAGTIHVMWELPKRIRLGLVAGDLWVLEDDGLTEDLPDEEDT